MIRRKLGLPFAVAMWCWLLTHGCQSHEAHVVDDRLEHVDPAIVIACLKVTAADTNLRVYVPEEEGWLRVGSFTGVRFVEQAPLTEMPPSSREFFASERWGSGVETMEWRSVDDVLVRHRVSFVVEFEGRVLAFDDEVDVGWCWD